MKAGMHDKDKENQHSCEETDSEIDVKEDIDSRRF